MKHWMIGIFTYLPFYDLVVNVSAVCKSFNESLSKGKEANVQLWMVVAEKLFLQFRSHIIESNFARFYGVRFKIQWRDVSQTVYRHLNARKYSVVFEEEDRGVYLFQLWEGDDRRLFTPEEVRRHAKKWIHARKSSFSERVCIVRCSSAPYRLSLYFQGIYALTHRLFLGYEPRAWFIELQWPENIDLSDYRPTSVLTDEQHAAISLK